SFAKDPPNATVSVFSKDGASVKDAVVVLRDPKLEGDKLTFTVQVLEGNLTGADGAASVFIDIFGFWRRAAFRGAMYAGAMAGAAPALGDTHGAGLCFSPASAFIARRPEGGGDPACTNLPPQFKLGERRPPPSPRKTMPGPKRRVSHRRYVHIAMLRGIAALR